MQQTLYAATSKKNHRRLHYLTVHALSIWNIRNYAKLFAQLEAGDHKLMISDCTRRNSKAFRGKMLSNQYLAIRKPQQITQKLKDFFKKKTRQKLDTFLKSTRYFSST